jgi:hypothetical protein
VDIGKKRRGEGREEKNNEGGEVEEEEGRRWRSGRGWSSGKVKKIQNFQI